MNNGHRRCNVESCYNMNHQAACHGNARIAFHDRLHRVGTVDTGRNQAPTCETKVMCFHEDEDKYEDENKDEDKAFPYLLRIWCLNMGYQY
jgi:hypothetical protein